MRSGRRALGVALDAARNVALAALGVALALPSTLQAQLAPPNAAGVAFGHVHLNVTDVEEHVALWVDHLGGVRVQKGPLVTVKIPGMLMVFTEREPTGDSEGSVMDHVGIAVRDFDAVVDAWEEAGYEARPEFTGTEGTRNAYLMAPDGVKIEIQEDTSLTVPASSYHVHFFTDGFRDLMDWYVELFGLTPRTRGSIETTADAPGMNLSFNGSRGERAATRGRAIDHVGFEIDGLEAFCEQLEARGIAFDVPYRYIDSIELAIAFFTDPSGVRIELTEGFDEY